MSDQPPADQQSSPEPPPETSGTEAKTKKERSKTERMIVWGAIGVLLVVAGAQALQWYCFDQSYNQISAAIKEADASDASDSEIDLREAEAMMSGYHSKSDVQLADSNRYIKYTWPGVYIDYRVLLTIGDDDENPLVFSVETNSESSNLSDMLTKPPVTEPRPTPPGAGDASGGRPTTPAGAGPGGPGEAPGPAPVDANATRRPSAEPDEPAADEEKPVETPKKGDE